MGMLGVYGAGTEGERGERGQELDKTGFYGLFRQLGVRTTFSTEARVEHKEKKRHIAKPYRNSEILKSSIVQGVEERSRAFLQNIEDSKDGIVDVYRYAHCYALDCASHFLIGKRGTKSIEEKLRWLVNHDELREMEKGFLAFGRGGRACMGKHLAQLEMWHLIQKVYTKYQTRIKYGWEIEGEKNMEMEDQIIASRPKDRT
ncbi:hypothetical protein DID88_000835 [Monilinia fructigena]|uniref:Cytochrome P450 n=1 Tax=Monilinia fructigena TaxID=38457 RepID=A0A395IJ15_9HELO|nr:hypothetical protein DID88_000835 [Monilinia fructigena]